MKQLLIIHESTNQWTLWRPLPEALIINLLNCQWQVWCTSVYLTQGCVIFYQVYRMIHKLSQSLWRYCLWSVFKWSNYHCMSKSSGNQSLLPELNTPLIVSTAALTGTLWKKNKRVIDEPHQKDISSCQFCQLIHAHVQVEAMCGLRKSWAKISLLFWLVLREVDSHFFKQKKTWLIKWCWYKQFSKL